MFRERAIEFITDLPKSPKDMAERLKKVPLWYTAASVVTVASLAACQLGKRYGFVTPPPEGTSTNPTETVPPVTLPSTEISPSLGVGETIVVAEQRYMSQQEILVVDPLVESKFQEFQEEIKANNPLATFAAWGALATAQTGETYFTPFFEVYNDGNLVSEYVNIGKIDGSIATIELKPGEVEGPDGKIYASLSQTVNADTNELLETPWPYIWIPYSRAEYNALPDDQKDKVPVYFSAIPGIVPQNEAPVAYGGAKTASIRMIIATPTPEPTVTPEPSVWQVAGKDYLVSLGENNIPEYQFVEGEGWQKVEQVSMVDAFGNTVPGWVVEKSDVWEGEISQASYDKISGFKYLPNSGLSTSIMSNVTLEQWQLMEFINSDGVKMQRLNLTWIFKNDQGKIITIKAGMPELNLEARLEKLSPRQIIDSLVVGGQTKFVSFFWVDTLSAMTPEKKAEYSNRYALDGELCKLSVQVCGLSIGRFGEVKHPTSWFNDIYSGLYGDNLDITDELWCQRYNR